MKPICRRKSAVTIQKPMTIPMVMGVLLVVGVPLPLFSYGGSSVVADMRASGSC